MGACRYAGMWTIVVLFMIIWNSDAGNWHDDERWWTMNVIVHDNFALLPPALDGIFQWLMPFFHEDNPDLMADVDDQDVESHTYTFLKNASLFHRKPDHISTNRFFGQFKRAMVEWKEWSCRQYGVMWMCAENDDKLPDIKRLLDLELVRPDPARRSTARQGEQARLLKTSMGSVMKLAYAMYSDRDSRFVIGVELQYGDELHRWWQRHNLETRSGPETKAWILAEVKGGFWKHLVTIALNLRWSVKAVTCGLGTKRAQEAIRAEDLCPESPAVAQHDQLAAYVGNFTLGLLAQRLKMGAHYLLGWPTRSVLLADQDADVRKKGLSEMKASYEQFQAMGLQAATEPVVRNMRKHSEWNCVTNIQLQRMAEEEGWTVTSRFQQHCEDRNETCWSDQLVEDGIGRSKAACAKAPNKRLSDTSVWLAPYKARVLDQVHRWSLPATDEVVITPADDADTSVYHVDPKTCWPLLDTIQGVSAPSWYSPGALRLNECWSESLVHQIVSRAGDGNFEGLSNTWSNSLLSGSEVLVRDKTGKLNNGNWSFPLTQAGTLAWWSWSAQCMCEGTDDAHWMPASPDPKLEFDYTALVTFIRDVGEWEAIPYRWQSPLHWRASFPNSRLWRDAHAHPRAKAVGGAEAFLIVAARHAFWSIAYSWLRVLARHLGIDLSNLHGEFAVVFAMVKAVLACDDATALDICRMREYHAKREACNDELEACEEALDVLSVADQKEILKGNKETKAKRMAVKAFQDARKAKRASLPAGKGHKGRGKGRKGKADPVGARRDRLLGGRRFAAALPVGAMDQPELKTFMPPGVYCWKSLTDGAYQAHFVEGRHYFSKRWTTMGAPAASRALVIEVWTSWLEFHELDLHMCPIAELFPAAPPAPAPPAPEPKAKAKAKAKGRGRGRGR